MRKVRKNRVIRWIPVMLIMLLIFYMSSQPATQSREVSSGVAQIIINSIEKVMPKTQVDWEFLNFAVRKCAHFSIYLLLGVFSNRAFRQEFGKVWQSACFAFIFCILYASSDEFHQLFVAGRSGEVRDVLIDSAGALLGILLGYIAMIWGKKRRNAISVSYK